MPATTFTTHGANMRAAFAAWDVAYPDGLTHVVVQPVITPAIRFAVHDLLTDLGRQGATTGKTARAIRAAQQWEGFQHSYHPAQIEAAQTLFLALTSPDDDAVIDAVEFVLELESAERLPRRFS